MCPKDNLATEEDRAYQIDRWAALFKATTWEELKMPAKTNLYIEQAITTIRQLTQEEKIRQQCEAQEKLYLRKNIDTIKWQNQLTMHRLKR